MPPDYASAAQALSISPSPSPEPHQTSGNNSMPPWARLPLGRSSESGSRGTPRVPAARRLSTPYSRGSAQQEYRPLGQRVMEGGMTAANNLLRLGYSMTPIQRAVAVVVGLGAITLLVLFLVFSERIFAALRPIAEGWRELPGGWVLLFLLCAVSAFPPLLGYSSTITLAGFIFGFPAGWPIVAAATVCGSTAAFVASRTVLSGYVQRLVGEDRRFQALGQVLRRDGLLVLVAIRLCPLPFSLSNGFLATIPSISPARFALATGLSTVKLLVHVFIGSRLALLADSEDMPTSTRVVNYLGILFGTVVGITVGWLVYQRTMRRAQEIALEDAAVLASTDGNGNGGVQLPDGGGFDYRDVEEGVLTRRSEDSDAAALMDDDDISLWDTTEDPHGPYRDDDEDTNTSPNPNPNSKRGDGVVGSRPTGSS